VQIERENEKKHMNFDVDHRETYVLYVSALCLIDHEQHYQGCIQSLNM